MKAFITVLSFACLWAAFSGFSQQVQAKPVNIKTAQLLVVTAASMSSTRGRLQRYSRNKGGWHKVGRSVAITLGYKGLGWGRGLHVVPRSAKIIKREGDGKAPIGIFQLGQAFGYSPFRVLYPYKVYGITDHCVDDKNSKFYNRIVKSSKVKRDYGSHEKMRLKRNLYKYGIVVNHNNILGGHSKKGAGSCIFLHISTKPTAGCTAMSESAIKQIIRWLERGKHPVLVQGTAAQVKGLMQQVGGGMVAAW